MAQARYLLLGSIDVTSGSLNVTVNSGESLLTIRPRDLIFVGGERPLIVDQVTLATSTITVVSAAPYTISAAPATVIAGQVLSAEALDQVEENNDIWLTHFGKFITWVSTSAHYSDLMRASVDPNTNQISYTAESLLTPAGLENLAADISQANIDFSNLQSSVTGLQTDVNNLTNTVDTYQADIDADLALAKDWATKAENIVVQNGLYSAFHWAQKAAASATDAETAETNAATSAANTATSESNAATSETNALASENKAEEWAVKAEDTVVTGTTDYSAFHWAQKAEDSATLAAQYAASAMVFEGTWDIAGNSNALPTTTNNPDLKTGSTYIITGDSVTAVSGFENGNSYILNEKDLIIKTATAWEYVDGSVTLAGYPLKAANETITGDWTFSAKPDFTDGFKMDGDDILLQDVNSNILSNIDVLKFGPSAVSRPSDNNVRGLGYADSTGLQISTDNLPPVVLNRQSTDGAYMKLYRDASVVGWLGFNNGDVFINSGNTVNSNLLRINTDKVKIGTQNNAPQTSSTATGMVLNENGVLGISASSISPVVVNRIGADDGAVLTIRRNGVNDAFLGITDGDLCLSSSSSYDANDFRLTDAGKLKVGTNNDAPQATSTTSGLVYAPGEVLGISNNGACTTFNRYGQYGPIMNFNHDGTTRGNIGINDELGLVIGSGDAGLLFNDADNSILPRYAVGVSNFNSNITLGNDTSKFLAAYIEDKVYFGGGLRIGTGVTSGNISNVISSHTSTPLEIRHGTGYNLIVTFDSNQVTHAKQNIFNQANYLTQGHRLSSETEIVDTITTFTKTLALSTSWQNTGITGTDLDTGTYIVQLFVDNFSQGGGHIDELYSGIMSWYGVAFTVGDDQTEILLHAAGEQNNNELVYLTVERQDGGELRLLIKSTTSATSTDYVFKFRRMI